MLKQLNKFSYLSIFLILVGSTSLHAQTLPCDYEEFLEEVLLHQEIFVYAKMGLSQEEAFEAVHADGSGLVIISPNLIKALYDLSNTGVSAFDLTVMRFEDCHR